MKSLVCHYAVLRFRPYPETGEFVNVGVALVSPAAGFFGFRCERRRHARVTQFFPEIDARMFKATMRGICEEMERIENGASGSVGSRGFLPVFKELTRMREDVISFGEPGSLMACSPKKALEETYDRFVARRFAHAREHQEALMLRQMEQWLRLWQIRDFYERNRRVGDERFRVTIPLVRRSGDLVRGAIKPLSLDRREATEVYQHGDLWLTNVRRLREFGHLPESMVFPVALPGDGLERKAADEIVAELRRESAIIVDMSNPQAVRNAIGA